MSPALRVLGSFCLPFQAHEKKHGGGGGKHHGHHAGSVPKGSGASNGLPPKSQKKIVVQTDAAPDAKPVEAA